MKFFRFFKYFLCITFSFLVLSSPVFAGANVAVKGEGDEVPSYVRSNITGYNFCLLYTSPSPRDVEESRMPSSA